MMKFITIFSLIILSSSCIKTADQVNREKRVDMMSEQLTDSQTLITDMVSQLKDMQSQLDKMNGRIEEMEHKQKQFDPAAVFKLSENFTLLQSQKESENNQLLLIQTELKEQRAFLEKVTASLNNIGQNQTKNPKVKKKSAKEELNQALSLVKNKAYEEAKPQLLGLLDNQELSAGDVNKALHGLGQIEFNSKNFDQALVYFSKIYTKYPKATLAPSSLLFIGKALQKLGKKDEAKEAFAKLTEDYPSAKESKEAKKEL
jgi:TolA-binding protein